MERLSIGWNRSAMNSIGRDAHLCLNEGFTLQDFGLNSTVHELCTNGLFSAYWG